MAQMQQTRRALMLGLSSLALAACAGGGRVVGSQTDEGGFGNPTAHNVLVLTGQMPFAIDLAHKFAREVPNTVNFEFDSTRLDQQAQAILLRQARWINQFPEVTFRVFGHADLVGCAHHLLSAQDGRDRRYRASQAFGVVCAEG